MITLVKGGSFAHNPHSLGYSRLPEDRLHVTQDRLHRPSPTQEIHKNHLHSAQRE